MIDKGFIYLWYKLPVVKYEMIRYLQKREMCMINKEFPEKSVRMLKCHSIQHFDYIVNWMVGMEQNFTYYNFYYSLARYTNGIPNQESSLKMRDNSEWTKTHFEQMESYDFLIDIDSGSFEELPFAYESAFSIKRKLDEWQLPYELRFSGKGFHFIVPYGCFDGTPLNPSTKSNIYKLYFDIAKWLYNNISEMVDCSIYDSRRVCKIPYSLAVYEEGTYVCYPLTEKEFTDFELSKMRPDMMETTFFRGRGSIKYNVDGSANKLIKEVFSNG